MALSEKLQMDPKLTLVKAKNLIRQQEAVHKQQDILREGSGSGGGTVGEHSLEYIRGNTRGGAYSSGRTFTPKSDKGNTAKCIRCGREKHSLDKCPARDVKCYKCQKIGHYGALCRSRDVSTLIQVRDKHAETQEDPFLGAINPQSQSQWTEIVHLNGHPIQFKLDTGAEVTAMSEATYNHIGRPHLEKSEKKLLGPAGTALSICGQFQADLVYKTTHSKQLVYVVQSLKTNLLGLPAIISLNLVARVHQVEDTKASVLKGFPNLFQGLGTMGEEYEIRLKDNVRPRALHTARNVPIPLRAKVQAELDRMQSLGVISPVDEPSPWCAGMVVVIKLSGNIRICVDLKPLNEGVLREFHPLPKVEDTLCPAKRCHSFLQTRC